MPRTSCWCCGNTFDERTLARLGCHPEVAVCAGCARWLFRRARSAADASVSTPAPALRRLVAAVRNRVMHAGLPGWPLLGPLLRRLDRHMH